MIHAVYSTILTCIRGMNWIAHIDEVGFITVKWRDQVDESSGERGRKED